MGINGIHPYITKRNSLVNNKNNMSYPGQQGEKCSLRNIVLLLFASDCSMIMPILQRMLCLSKTESFCYKTFSQTTT